MRAAAAQCSAVQRVGSAGNTCIAFVLPSVPPWLTLSYTAWACPAVALALPLPPHAEKYPTDWIWELSSAQGLGASFQTTAPSPVLKV